MQTETVRDPPKSDWVWALVTKQAAYYQIIKEKKRENVYKRILKFGESFLPE